MEIRICEANRAEIEEALAEANAPDWTSAASGEYTCDTYEQIEAAAAEAERWLKERVPEWDWPAPVEWSSLIVSA